MDKYLALGDYKAYVIDADDWDSAVWKAEQHFGSALYSITKMPKEEELPFAQKRGRWIWDDEGYHCSECWDHAYGNTGEVISGDYKFCPNCGAVMERSDE